jgi:hypothetical protein
MNLKNALVTTYLETNISKNPRERSGLWRFLQLLTFVRSLEDKQKTRKVLSQQVYYAKNLSNSQGHR